MSVAGKRRGRRSSTNSSDRCPTNDEPSRLRLEGNSETRRHRGGRTVVVAEQLTHVHEHRLAAWKDEHAADPDVEEVAIGLVGLEEESRSRRRIHEGEAHRALVVHELVYVFRGGLRHQHAEARADGHGGKGADTRRERVDVLIVVAELEARLAMLLEAGDPHITVIDPEARPDREVADDEVVAEVHTDMELVGAGVRVRTPERDQRRSASSVGNFQVYAPIERVLLARVPDEGIDEGVVERNDASIKRDAVRVIVEAATDSGEIAELVSVVESRANDGAAAKRVIEPGRRAHRVLLEAGLEARVVLVQELVVTVHEHTEPRARLIGAPSQPRPSLGQSSAFAPLLL